MNQFHTFIVALFIFTSCGNPDKNEINAPIESDAHVLKNLTKYSEDKDFFKLKSSFELNKEKLSKGDYLFFEALVENTFNNPAKSNIAISTLISLPSSTVHDSLMTSLYLLKILNHTNLYEYGLAAQTGESLLKNYPNLLDSSEIASVENTNKIWQALKDTEKQVVVRDKDYTMPMPRDIAGLYNISTAFPDSSLDFIFDTGANFSVIRRSLVKELGLKLIKSDFLVTAATGTKVKSDLAVAESFSIGGMTINNAVFLVFEDEDLSFPGYDIYGIIGYPVIEALGEIHLKEGEIFIPKEITPYTFDNFALDGFMPILSASHEGDSLLFHFDTGAAATKLYQEYFNKYQIQIESNNELETFSSGSAGGMVEFDGYKISGFKLSIADSKTILDSLQLHIENIGGTELKVHGNLGQDFIKQFDKMIISFEHSSILFE